MRKYLLTPLIALAFLSPAFAGDAPFEVTSGWVKPSLAGKNLTAAFFDLKNTGAKARTLLSVTSSAGVAEIHTTALENGVMKMRHLEAVELPAGGAVSFKPKEKHIMLMKLPEPLKAGDAVTLTLHFDENETLQAVLPVRQPQ